MLHQAALILALGIGTAEPSPAPPAPVRTAPAPAAPQNAAPTVTFARVSDKTFTEKVVAPHKGKLLFVNLWGSFCAPCLTEIPMFLRVLGAQKDTAVVYVAVDGPATEADARRALEKRKIAIASFLVENADPEPFILAADPSWSGQVPYTIVFAPDGTRLMALDGEQNEQELRAALDKARALAGGLAKDATRP
jgi:thiol-disulfide isomerase/thioredoxin